MAILIIHIEQSNYKVFPPETINILVHNFSSGQADSSAYNCLLFILIEEAD